MRKFLLLFVAATLCVTTVSAQRVKYQGEIHTGFGFGVGSNPLDRYCIETIHGVRVGSHFFTGIGVGFNHYKVLSTSANILPLFLNFKGYLLKSRVTPYLSADVGYGLTLGDSGYGYEEMDGRLLFYPALGVQIRAMKCFAVNLDVGFHAQMVNAYGRGDTYGAVMFRVGFSF